MGLTLAIRLEYNGFMAARERLKAWRGWRRISQGEAADILDCSQAVISKIETGERGPSLDVAVALAAETADWPDGPIRSREWVGPEADTAA